MTDWTRLLRELAPQGDAKIIAMIGDHADAVFPAWGIDTIRRQATLLAHAYVETAGFTKLEENLNYSAERLVEVWPNRFKSVEDARPYAQKPHALAIKVYGDRMGDKAWTDDGWVFRGKGLWQCTGQNNTAAIAKKLGVSPYVAAAWLVHPDHALECACALYQILGVKNSADSGDVAAQTLRINGGTNGLAARKAAFNKVVRLLALSQARARVSYFSAGDAEPYPPKISIADLRKDGSRTIKGADQAQAGIAGAIVSLGGAGAALSQVQDMAGQANDALGAIKNGMSAIEAIRASWPIVALALASIAAGYFIWRAWQGAYVVKLARVNDANTGVNLAS